MSKPAQDAPDIPPSLARHVRDACLCLHAQRAARVLARHFDAALRPAGMTNGQFSLMMALSGPEPPPPSRISELLGMDRTSLTAMLKPLQRRGWVEVRVDGRDRRSRRPALTPEGRAALAGALPIWRREHAAVEAALADPQALRDGLNAVAFEGQGATGDADRHEDAAAPTPVPAGVPGQPTRPLPVVPESTASAPSRGRRR